MGPPGNNIVVPVYYMCIYMYICIWAFPEKECARTCILRLCVSLNVKYDYRPNRGARARAVLLSFACKPRPLRPLQAFKTSSTPYPLPLRSSAFCRVLWKMNINIAFVRRRPPEPLDYPVSSYVYTCVRIGVGTYVYLYTMRKKNETNPNR